MKRIVRVTADDFGLTRGITDSLMQCAQEGMLNQVSMMGNGDAFDYAVKEFTRLTKPVDIALHLNITEGAALSERSKIPHLVDAHGFFRSGPILLWIRYLCALPSTRRAMRREVATEMLAQWKRLQNALSENGHSVSRLDAHQHVHMVPFVFDEVAQMPGITSVRASAEPFYFVPSDWPAYFGFRTISRVALWFLSKRNINI